MTQSPEPEFNNNENGSPVSNDNDRAYLDIKNDPDYAKLMEHYQKGEKELSMMVLNTLEKRYPDHPELRRIKEDLQLKSSVRDLTDKIRKGERRENRRETLNLAIFAVVGTIIVMVAFYLTSRYLLPRTVEEVLDRNAAQLSSLQSQAEGLLDIGRPAPALEIIETMRGINPDWEALPGLSERAENLLELETQYNRAIDLAADGKNAEALSIFQSIEETEPGLWDVSRQISLLDQGAEVNALLDAGQAAFNAGDWAGVISAYERARDLDASINDPVLVEQLLGAYLNEIERILQNENASMADIEQAETYYRSAAAALPQGGGFTTQRERLEDVEDLLQERKFTRMARDIFFDPNQTLGAINSAVSYLKRAAAVNPENAFLRQAVINAEDYQAGFGNFVVKNWEPAIEYFTTILSSGSDYLKAHARVLLYEAYFGYGRALVAEGEIEAGLAALESAEEMALADQNNLMKFFQVQLLVGDINWRAGNFEEAFAAYQEGMETIGVRTRLEGHPEIQRSYVEAISFAENDLFENAYENFQVVRDNLELIYKYTEVTVKGGSTLAFIANNNQSTIHTVNQANNLADDVVAAYSGTLQVPSFGN